MSFKTQKEIWMHLISGGRIKSVCAVVSDLHYFLNTEGRLVDNSFLPSFLGFSQPEEWQIYEEPKPKRKVTLYRYTYRDHEIQQSWWTEMTFEKYKHGLDRKLLQTETKEIEIEEPST